MIAALMRTSVCGGLLALLLLTGCMGSHNRPMQLISGAGPIYPVDAQAARIQGEVVVRYDVTAKGVVINARIETSDPAGVFDEAALAAVRSWKYNPRIRDGKTQEVQNILSVVRFRLDDEDAYDDY
jgi:TonB family protein